MSKERRLGRGLAALLGTPDEDSNEPIATTHATKPASIGAAAAAERTEAPKPKLHQPSASMEDAPGAGSSSTDKELLLSVSLIEENPFQPRREFGRDRNCVARRESQGA